MTYALHPEAREDLWDAAVFYREHANNELALAFLEEFERSIAMILDHPKVGAIWRHGARRYPMRRFPFFIVYSESGKKIHVLAVAHQSRQPDYWRQRAG